MKNTLRGSAGALVLTIGLLATALPAGAFTIDLIMKNDLKLHNLPSSTLNLGGSSFDEPLVQAAETKWNTATGKAPFASYIASKSGIGRANAISGAYNIGFSDFPLNIAGLDVGPGSSDSGETTANYVQVPVAAGGVAIMYHFGTGVSSTLANLLHHFPLTLTGVTLGKIMSGHITKWNDLAICATNPHLVVSHNCLLPNLAIAVLSRTSGSGTTFIYQDFLSRVDHADFATASAASFPAAVATFANSGLMDAGIHATLGAIGYAEFGYAVSNNALTVNLINRSNKNVAISGAGILAAETAGLAYLHAHGGFNTATLNGFSINNSLGATVWPISGFSYAIVKKNQVDANTGIAIVKFLDFLSHQGGGLTVSKTFGQDLADSNGYAPLAPSLQVIARSLLLNVQHGGHTILSANN